MNIRNLFHFFRSVFHKSPGRQSVAKFVDLAPTANAENAEIYFEALNYATSNDKVLNIALTGPYGSGKSSVINSFLARYKRPYLQLSLASFLPNVIGDNKKLSKQEIERSILQQMLYGVEADKLPFSRFKRIQIPSRGSIEATLFIAVGLACAWYIFNKQADIVSGAFFKPQDSSNWFNYTCVGVLILFVWKVVYSIYTASFGFSLKSISLKDVQIAPAATSDESILNRHLDEILYFFQSTHYDLVIIEDLDRFENSDIFVTLREINGLINANEGVKRRVRFLYALRDDIFTNTDRTKFFEFIVPIIPIINHSNSIDKVLEQGQRVNFDTRLNRQFLREVSRYLTDLRLIRNIFNEYVIYEVNLKAGGEVTLDPNKLLAILIYKNVMPKDFAALHRQEGALSQVLSRYDQYVSKLEGNIRDEMSAIETDLQIGEEQVSRDQSDLRKIYAMTIIEHLSDGYQNIQTSSGSIKLGGLANSDFLEEIISQRSIVIFDDYNRRLRVNLPDIENHVDPAKSFSQRKADIERKSEDFKQRSDARLRELRTQLASLRTRRFNEVVRESAELIDQIFADVGDSRELLRYLVLEGHLDDTYYQYISLFHEGRLSPNDNNFLIQIRAYNNPIPDFQIDNVAEVIASMRAEDFGRNYVLNRFIFDGLFSNIGTNSRRVNAALDFIASHFSDCGDFFRSYYAKGTHVEGVIQSLTARWPNFAAVALGGADGASHAARILAYSADQQLMDVSNAGALRTFLSDNMRQVLAEGVDFDIGRLRSLEVEISEVSSLADFPGALVFVAQEGLYRISIDNIKHILSRVVGWQDIESLDKQHFSTLMKANDVALLNRVRANFPAYVTDVLLELEKNVDEDAAAILEVLACEDIEYESRAEFLQRQTAILSNFDGIPAAFCRIMLENEMVEPTWENCLEFMYSDAFSPDLLTEYLQGKETAAALSTQPIPDGEEWFRLRKFIVENDGFSPAVYRSYVRRMPEAVDEFPEVEMTKIKILIEERRVVFSHTSFAQLHETDLRVLFVAQNFDAFEIDQDQYPIDDAFRAMLLKTGIADAQKLKLIADMDESYVAGAPAVAADIGPILERSLPEERDYSFDFIKAVILNSSAIRVQISLFNRFHLALSGLEVREILGGMTGTFQDIATFGKSPKIENNEINLQFAGWLRNRGVISSFNFTSRGDEIKIHTFRKGNLQP